MKIYKFAFLSFLGLSALVGCSDDDVDIDDDDEPVSYSAALGSLNGSGVTGTMTAVVNDEDDTFTVTINASGMTPNEVHAQHVHGQDDDSFDATCPDASADTDNDGFISVPEGAPAYGMILIPLENFPTADANGDINYTRTFDLDDVDTGDGLSMDDIGDLEDRAVVLHGMMVNGTYDGMLPVACAPITRDASN